MSNQPLPTLFLPHGAGPCFFMDWEPADMWTRMAAWLESVPVLIGRRPRAVVVVSAHWEASAFTVTSRENPNLLFDYYGFPEHTYRLDYPARGAPEVAARVHELLASAGLAAATDARRGLDHGVFIPFKLIYPRADTPIVQLSLRAGLDPDEHIAAGRALKALRDEDVLIVGSGMTFHNMRRFQWRGGPTDPDSERFDNWLRDTVSLTTAEREQRLRDWAAAPSARAAHPREEHLLPLHVVAGAGGGAAGTPVYHDRVLGSVQSAIRFG